MSAIRRSSRASALLVMSFALLATALTFQPANAGATYGCGTNDQEYKTITGARRCGAPLRFTLSAPATGILRVVGDDYTGYIGVSVNNAGGGAKCVGQGQEHYTYGCGAQAEFVDGEEITAIWFRPGPASVRVTLAAGTYTLQGVAGLALTGGLGTWRVELVLD